MWVVAGDAGHYTVVQWQGVRGFRDRNVYFMFSGDDAFDVAISAKTGERLNKIIGVGRGGGMTVGAGVVCCSTCVGADE